MNNYNIHKKKRSILIVDDDNTICVFLKSVLTKAGYEISLAPSGRQGVNEALTLKPDMVLMDIFLPDGNGINFCSEIKNNPELVNTHVIIITGKKRAAVDTAHGLNMGADDYMVKPLDSCEVLARVNALFRLTSIREELQKAKQSLEDITREYEMVFEGTQDAMFLICVEQNQQFRFMRTNKAHQDATGIALSQIRGKTPEELLGHDAGREIKQNYVRCVQGGIPVNYEETLNLPGGERTWHTTLTPVSENGSIRFIVGSSQDITERKKAEKMLRYLATTDELTGLWNRRYFSQALIKAIEGARRHDRTFSLLMLDIDHFKRINDSFGHAAGDEVLRHFGQIVTDELRIIDTTGRFGGEEFAVILPDTDLQGAEITAERIRKRVAGSPAVCGDVEVAFNVSIGVALWEKEMRSMDELIKKADDALYEAKRMGRNRTVVSK
ncbi:GGDEF domain-containing response regulator [Desulfonatronovibrio magnus]|uniref:GGDEF domain-containing response regulator n=1 Tax=Desulfonatronovibrio magnus TaxID=698827 RepID=UPI000696C4E4|nr:diguanylate cyclase [Desulfonatronovibrio magnus]